MRDYLLDIIQHTHGLGGIDLVKVVGTDTDTQITASSEDRTVIIYGNFKAPLSEFKGTFGMPNLAKLKTIVNFDDYNNDSNAIINVTRGTVSDPTAASAIHFETVNGDFVNDYRLMAKTIVEDKVKNVTFKGTTWDVEFEPLLANILRLKKQAQANSEEQYFKTKTEKKDLKIYFGDASTHSGNFVFESNVSGSINKPWNWPVKVFLAIMDLPGDKIVRISDAGVTEITVDSGLAIWRYLLPAQAK
jgi:hypothetical protein